MIWLRSVQSQYNLTSEELAINILFFADPGNKKTAKLSESNQNILTISTIHKAKNLEWKNVIVVIDTWRKIKEGEHLPYVAYTGTKNNLFLISSGEY